ncbi:MAG TPA: AAA family ATPase [Acidimicrobiales bacterium]|nr:AAA family ATPase [Acidimicrobiales bacterium]
MRMPPPDCGLVRFDLVKCLEGDGPPEPLLLRRRDGRALLYPAAVHSLAGEPGAGKSWVAIAGVAEVVSSGVNAIFLDYEDTAATMASRLLAVGVEPDAMDRVAYLQVSGAIGTIGLTFLADMVERGGVALVVIDAVADSLAAEGCSENDAVDVSGWIAKVPRPLARAGAAVLLVDHVTKDESSRGRYARGSGAKLAGVDGAAFVLDVEEPFSREASGRGSLRLAKDRHGSIGRVGEVVATVRFEVHAGSLTAVVLDRPDHDGQGSPRDIDERRVSPRQVVERLQTSGGHWSSVSEAASVLEVSRQAASDMLTSAVLSGLVVEDKGPGNARSFHLPTASPYEVVDLEAARRHREEQGQK